MGRRFSATLGFAVGLGAASLLNLDFYSAMVQRAIAAIDSPIGHSTIASATAVQPLATATSCATNDSSTGLRTPHPKNISLLKHVPALPQRLNWYGITQENAIANAPRPQAPKPALTQWNRSNSENLRHLAPCGNPPSALTQGHPSPLQQQAHFILSLASLNQKNDWLLQPQAQAPQPVHHIWHGSEPMEIKLAKTAE